MQTKEVSKFPFLSSGQVREPQCPTTWYHSGEGPTGHGVGLSKPDLKGIFSNPSMCTNTQGIRYFWMGLETLNFQQTPPEIQRTQIYGPHLDQKDPKKLA